MTNDKYIAMWEKRESLRQERIDLLVNAESEIDVLCKKRFRELHPKSRRKLDGDLRPFAYLPPGLVDEIAKPVVDNTLIKRNEIDREIDYLKNELEVTARHILPTISTEIYTLVTKDGGDYRSVGYGCNTYAKVWVEYFKQFLDAYNIPSVILSKGRETVFSNSEKFTYYRYELRGNCHPAIFYALSRQSPKGTIAFPEFCNKMLVNMKVYF